MYKRIVALLVSMCMIICTLTCLSGCGKKGRYFTFGQWLQLVNESFGMTSYTSESPYFGNVGKNSEYFDAVQIATEWEVIDKNASFSPTGILKWKDALITLVNVGGFMNQAATDEEKIQFAINNFDTEIRDYWMKRSISQEDATILLAKAKQMWITKRFDENVEEYKVRDNVFDISDSEKVSVEEEGTIVLKDFSDADAVQKDMIVLVPDGSGDPLGKEYVKVNSAETKDGNLIIYPSNEEVSFDEVYDEVFIQDTTEAYADNCVIYDGNGEIISVGANVQNMISNGNYSATKLRGNTSGAELCAGKAEAKFKIDGIEISLAYNLDGKLNMEFGVKSANLLKSENQKLQSSAKFQLSDVAVTKEFDYSWMKLHSATLKVDYKIKNTFAFTYKNEITPWTNVPERKDNESFLANFNKGVVAETGLGSKEARQNIKIVSVDIYNAGIASVRFDVSLKFTVEGSIELVVTQNNCQGIEYKNGNIRLIDDKSNDVDFQIKAKAELTLNLGPALYITGIKKPLVGIEIAAGVGAKTEVTTHLVDEEHHRLESLKVEGIQPEDFASLGYDTDLKMSATEIEAIAKLQGGIYSHEESEYVKVGLETCLDISLYAVLSVGVTDNCFLVSAIGNKVTLSWKILSDKNAKFANYHVDNWDFSSGKIYWGKDANEKHCTLQFKGFDKDDMTGNDADVVDNQADNSSNSIVPVGSALSLSTMTVTLQKGASETISVVTIPEGYSMADIIFKSNDSTIATVDSSGKITAKKAGSVIVYVETKDGKHSQLIAVLVLMPENAEDL